MTPKAEALYDMVTSKDPKAVAYYINLKRRIADGQRAQVVHDAIQTVHERRKAMKKLSRNRTAVGADYPAGSYLTPNGKVLTPQALSQLVTLIQAAYGGGFLASNPSSGSYNPTGVFAAGSGFPQPRQLSFASPLVTKMVSPSFAQAALTPKLSSLGNVASTLALPTMIKANLALK